MSNIVRKIFSFLLVIVILTGSISTSIVAKGASSTDFVYTINNNKISITGYNGNATDVIIPSRIEGYPVVSIGDRAFWQCVSLKSVIIPNSVISIGDWAFFDCSSLESVTMPNSVTTIGRNAFCGCVALSGINIPTYITNIGIGVFSGCSSLTSMTIPMGVTIIGESAFSFCSSLRVIAIPNSVTTIGRDAFMYCSSLSSITIPNSVTNIGEFAFEQCSSLKSVTIPDGVISIGDWAFKQCGSLINIIVSESNKEFSDDNGVLFNKTKTTLKCYPNGKKDKFFTILNSVTHIEQAAFEKCRLTSITIPNTVENIGDNAFGGCDLLKEIYYNGSEIEWSKISIGQRNDPLKNATIHFASNDDSNDKPIENEGNTDITQKTSGAYGSNLAWSLYLNEGILTISGRGDMEKITSAPWKDYYSSIKKVIIQSGVTSISEKAFAKCANLTEIIISSGVKTIGCCAFEDCLSLKTITIPSSVEKIYAKSHSIHNSAFCNCAKLTDIYYGGTQKQWANSTDGMDFSPVNVHFSKVENSDDTLIDEEILDLFDVEPFKIGSVKVGGLIVTGYNGKTENVVIPEEINGEQVVAIGEGAFLKCDSIESITLPRTVKLIEKYAFSEKGALSHIFFKESRAIWADVVIAHDLEQLLKEKVTLHCKTTMYTSEPDRCLAVGKSFYMLAQVDSPKDAIITISFSNDKTIKLGEIKDGDSWDSLVAKYVPGKDFSKFVKFDVIGTGIVDICISVKTKDGTSYFYDTMYCYDESLDYYSVYRAENIEDMKWDGDLINDKDEEYCGWADGIVMSDFNYSKATKDGKSGWIFNINAYNGRSNNGICEVFDSKGKLIDAVCIEPYEIKAFDGIYTLGETIGNCFCKVSEHGLVSFKTIRTETKISVFVPDGGYIRITNDMALSSLCAFYNFVDIAFMIDDFVESFNSVMDGEKVSAPKFKSAVTESVLNCYINGVEKAFETKTELAVKSYLTEGFSQNTMLKFCDMLTAVAVTKDGLADAGRSLVDSASNELLKLFKVNAAFDMYAFLANTADAAFTVEDIISTTGYNKSFHIYATIDKESVKEILERAGVSVDTRGNVPPEAILHTYKILADDEILEKLDNGECINEYETYEIAFIKDGYKVQPTDKVEVSIELSDKLKGKNLSVFRENDDGTWEIIDCRVEDGKVIFEVDHFCVFVVAEYNANINRNGAGNTPISKVVYIVAVAIGLSVILVTVGIIVVVKVRKIKNC